MILKFHSACSNRQSLGLLHSWVAQPNSYPNTCMPSREAVCTIFMMVFGRIRLGREPRTYFMRGRHAIKPLKWNPFWEATLTIDHPLWKGYLTMYRKSKHRYIDFYPWREATPLERPLFWCKNGGLTRGVPSQHGAEPISWAMAKLLKFCSSDSMVNRVRKSRTTLQNKVRLKVLPEQLALFVNTSVTLKKCTIQ